MEYNEMNDIELCKAHSKWWGEAMEHQCAEGSAYFRERSDGIRAECECEKIEKIFEKRGIGFGWRTVRGVSLDSLRHAYTKHGADILID